MNCVSEMISWNPWHGCTKYSAGCKNCYVYRMDKQYGRDPSKVKVTKAFHIPLAKNRKGEYKYPSGTTFFTCYTSDFFLPEMKEERKEAWKIMKERSDCHFFIITKRIDIADFPDDWKDGYDNVEIECTIENQEMFNYRWPIFKNAPIKHKSICFEPLLSHINVGKLDNIEKIVCGGESGYGEDIRHCEESWVRDLYNCAQSQGIPFCFKQTGTYFHTLDGRNLKVARKDQFNVARKLPYQDFDIENIHLI